MTLIKEVLGTLLIAFIVSIYAVNIRPITAIEFLGLWLCVAVLWLVASVATKGAGNG